MSRFGSLPAQASLQAPKYTANLVSSTSVSSNALYISSLASTSQTTITVNGSNYQPQYGNTLYWNLNTTFGVYTSGNFSGSNYLTVPASSVFAFGTGDFTVECWVYPTSYQAWSVLFAGVQFGSGSDWGLYLGNGTTAGLVMLQFTSNGTQNIQISSPVALNVWTHIAVTRKSTTATIWINGVSSISSSQNYSMTSTFVRGIGAGYNGNGSTTMQGRIYNLRVANIAVYTGTFTPPTAPLSTTQSASTNISAITSGQTVLLALNNSTTVTTDATGLNTITNTNNVVNTTSSPVIPTPLFSLASDLGSSVTGTIFMVNKTGTGSITVNTNTAGVPALISLNILPYSSANRFAAEATVANIYINNIAGSLPPVSGSIVFNSTGTTTWTVPANVYSIDIVTVGGGGGGGGKNTLNYIGKSGVTNGGGGGGGALAYVNSQAVTPGQILTINVGSGGSAGSTGGSTGLNTGSGTNGTAGTESNVVISGSKVVGAGGGGGGSYLQVYYSSGIAYAGAGPATGSGSVGTGSGGSGGTVTTGLGFSGGNGGLNMSGANYLNLGSYIPGLNTGAMYIGGGGGGGAGGYIANGGQGGAGFYYEYSSGVGVYYQGITSSTTNGTSSTSGGGGGGGTLRNSGGQNGGGVYLDGQGSLGSYSGGLGDTSNTSGGITQNSTSGTNGSNDAGSDGAYGAGGGGNNSGQNGAVRIIWPSTMPLLGTTARAFPSTSASAFSTTISFNPVNISASVLSVARGSSVTFTSTISPSSNQFPVVGSVIQYKVVDYFASGSIPSVFSSSLTGNFTWSATNTLTLTIPSSSGGAGSTFQIQLYHSSWPSLIIAQSPTITIT